ncbi:hypothetical protein FD755_011806 [Muntiacus reevesi]|uniref:Uncharacterized protein n=1 Tax=Muntiacus reevesi TaxID=9886 RepID=A0A5N3XU60_MUNRE|nr:hypothetical protein FD755_011806 [Muntiacus reevesi]
MPANARDTGSIPDLGRSHMPHSNRAHVPQLLMHAGSRAHSTRSIEQCLIFMSKVNTYQEFIMQEKWHPTPVFLPGKSHGQRSLVGYCPWGHKESDTTEQLHFHFLMYMYISYTYICIFYIHIKYIVYKIVHILHINTY